MNGRFYLMPLIFSLLTISHKRVFIDLTGGPGGSGITATQKKAGQSDPLKRLSMDLLLFYISR